MSRSLVFSVLLAIACLASASAAHAGVTAGGQLFTNFRLDLTDLGYGKSYGEFDVQRAYFDFGSKITPNVKLRATTDVYSKTSADQVSFKVQRPGYSDTTIALTIPRYYEGWGVRMKFAYLDITNILPNTTIRFGMQPEALTGKSEAFWGYRFVERVQIDLDGGLSPADLGVSLLRDLPRGFGSVQIQAQNGPSYARREDNKYKDISALVQLLPANKNPMWKFFTVQGYLRKGYSRASGKDYRRDVWNVGAGYLRPSFNLGFELNNTSNESSTGDVSARGYSLCFSFSPGCGGQTKDCTFFTRFDSWDPNMGKNGGDNARTRMFLGVSRQMAKNVRCAFDYQGVSISQKNRSVTEPFLKDSHGIALEKTHQVFTHFEVKF
ncbi:MAG: hypothetical protein QME66_07125 [Candidatus Eisenbacteria bacterium]|nr:hypothetical protein [Candidatus Eisenbacteria bacterium]